MSKATQKELDTAMLEDMAKAVGNIPTELDLLRARSERKLDLISEYADRAREFIDFCEELLNEFGAAPEWSRYYDPPQEPNETRNWVVTTAARPAPVTP